jgi:hypothetical protein
MYTQAVRGGLRGKCWFVGSSQSAPLIDQLIVLLFVRAGRYSLIRTTPDGLETHTH